MDSPKYIEKMKVVELRDELRARNLETSGRKAELLSRLKDAIDHEQIEHENNQKEEDSSTTTDNVSDVKEVENTSCSTEQSEIQPTDAATNETPHTALTADNVKTNTIAKDDCPSLDETDSVKEATSTSRDANQNTNKQTNQHSEASISTEVSPGKEAVETNVPKKINKTHQAPKNTEVTPSKRSASAANSDQSARRKRWHGSSNTRTEAPLSSETIFDESTLQNILGMAKEKSASGTESTVAEPPTPARSEGSPSEEEDADIGDTDNDYCIVHVTKLKRPYTRSALRLLLESAGALADGDDVISTDKIRSQCYVQYMSHEDAVRSAKTLSGMTWPPRHGQQLSAKLVEVDAFKIPEASSADAQDPKQTDADSKQPVEPVMLLDELFRKTKMEPAVYWLPVSEEEKEIRKSQRARRQRSPPSRIYRSPRASSPHRRRERQYSRSSSSSRSSSRSRSSRSSSRSDSGSSSRSSSSSRSPSTSRYRRHRRSSSPPRRRR